MVDAGGASRYDDQSVSLFWQASEEVEEEKAAGQSTLAMRKGASGQELR